MAVFFNDTFDEASDTGLASHTPNIGGAYSHNANSASSGGTVTAGSGKVVMPGGSVNIFNNAATPGAADYTASGSLRWEGADGRMDCILRAAGSNGYYFYANFSGTFTIFRDATFAVTVATGTHTATTGFTDYAFSISVTGTTISFTLDGTTISGTDSTWSSAGLVAIGGREMSYTSASANDSTAGDTTAPTLTSPTGTGSTLTSAGGVTTDEGNGTLYMVTTASATAPTKAQVKDGKDHAGASALRASNTSVASTGAKTFSAASCTAGTRYNHYMHEDAAANQSNVVSSASFVVGSGVTFSGTVPAQSGVTGDSFSLDLSTYFSGNMARTYAVQSGSLTSSGLSLNTSTGIVSGTLATVGAYTISVRATDTYSDTDDTNSFTITISSTGTAPTVSSNPSNTTVTAGATASFTASASGSPTPTVQWQENTGSWTNISGQTSTTLSLGIVGTVDSGRVFRAVFTNASGSATTTSATLTVNAAAGDGTITSEPLKNNMGQLLGANTLTWCGFRNASTGADVLLLTSVSVNSSSVFTTGTNAALAPGQLYAINWKTADGKYGCAWANAV